LLKNKLYRYTFIHLLIIYIILTIIILLLSSSLFAVLAFSLSYIVSVAKLVLTYIMLNKLFKNTSKRNVFRAIILLYFIYTLAIVAIFTVTINYSFDIFLYSAVGILSITGFIFFVSITCGKTIKLID